MTELPPDRNRSQSVDRGSVDTLPNRSPHGDSVLATHRNHGTGAQVAAVHTVLRFRKGSDPYRRRLS